MKKIGILGVSGRTISLLKLITTNKLFEISGVYDPNEEQANILAEKLETKASSNPFGIITASDILVIPKTDDTSYNLIIESILNSKQVIVEKPCNLTIVEVEELNKLSAEAEVSVVPYLPYRFSNCILNTKSYIFNPGFVNINYCCAPEFRTSKASKLELLLNLIDIPVNLIKANVKRVNASSVSIIDNSSAIFCIRLEFDNGSTANITTDTFSNIESLQISVYQTNQIANLDLIKNVSLIKNFNKGNALEYDVIKPLVSKDENPYEEIINYINMFGAYKTTVSMLDSFKHSLHTLRKVEERIFQHL